MIKNCVVCGKKFDGWGAQKYCSKVCYAESRRVSRRQLKKKKSKAKKNTRLLERVNAAKEAGLSYGQYMAREYLNRG